MRTLKQMIIVAGITTTLFVLAGCATQNDNMEVPKTNNDFLANEAEEKQPKEKVEELKEKVEELKEEVEEVKEQYAYISASSLRMREEPNLDSKIISSIKQGTKVKILEETINSSEEKWARIIYNTSDSNKEGWISLKYTDEKPINIASKGYEDLDLSPQNKAQEYENNPRVKVKGIYVTAYSVSGSKLDELIALAKETQINTFVIDVKGDGGEMLFHTKAAEKYNPKANEKIRIRDIEGLMKKLKENNIYTIARIVSFKDPIYTGAYPERAIVDRNTGKLYAKSDGLNWATAHDRILWEYNVAVAKEAAKAGFNEIQFDYVRFPASNGGKLDKVLDYRNKYNESKPKAIQEYLKYAYKELSEEKVYISADIYGLVGSVRDDMGLGQYWEAISNVVDYISPMMYPSHYGSGVYGLKVPDAKPYATINQSIKDSINRNNIETPAAIRPWIQDFTASWVKGHIKYGEQEVKAQIKALSDNGVDEFLLWNAANRYTESAIK